MSSSQPFLPSSPISLTIGGGRRRRSRFTYKHLSQLSLSSTSCPLRVIAHIDLDAFYAQCEMVRLNVSEDQPLAVQVSYFSSCLRVAMLDLTDVQSAMARSYRHQLPGTEVRHEQAHNHHRSQEAVPGSDHAARCYVEGRG